MRERIRTSDPKYQHSSPPDCAAPTRSYDRRAGRFEKTSRGTFEPDSHPSRGCVLPRKAKRWSGQPKYPNPSPPEINTARVRTKTFPGELRGGRPLLGTK